MKIKIPSIILAIVFVTCLSAACGTPLPSPDATHINIFQMEASAVTMAEVEDAFSGNLLTLPFFQQSPDSTLYAIVISFDIPRLPEGVDFTIINILLSPVKSDGSWNENVKVVALIPDSTDKISDVEASRKVSAEISGTISVLTGKVGLEQEQSTTYQQIYRSVATHESPEGQVYWEFTPFFDEPILPGRYHVVAIVELPNAATGNKFYAQSSCAYEVSGFMGDKSSCGAGSSSTLIIP